MASKPEISSFDSWDSAEQVAFGICEVISVGECDELPYIFEIVGGQKLSFSLTASHEVDLVLCDEGAYDEWVDAGLPTQHPEEALLTLRHACPSALWRSDPGVLAKSDPPVRYRGSGSSTSLVTVDL